MSNPAEKPYINAMLFVALAAALEALLWRWIQPSISPLFTAAVMLAAIYGGLGPGLVATALAVVASAFFFLPPTYSLDIGGDDVMRLTVFTAVAVVVSSVADARRRAELRAARARESAERANRAKDHFLALVGHELRSPLSPVLAVADLLESDPSLPDAVREDARMIRRNVQFQNRLIEDLLDSSRIESGKLELRLERCDVHSVLHDCLAMCADEAAAKSLRLDVRLDPGADRFIRADPARLRQVFANLLRNAIKFTPQGGPPVTLTATALPGNATAGNATAGDATARDGDARGVRIEVSDGGAGIDREVLPRIFRAYEQGGRGTTRRHGGLGLGLTIARAIVQGHGGTIHAHSDGPGRGAVFTVELPPEHVADNSAAAAAAAAAATPRGSDSAAPAHHGARDRAHLADAGA